MLQRIKLKLAAINLKLLINFVNFNNIVWLFQHYMLQKPTFKFNGVQLDYFFHSYNNFRISERAVEIPIIKHYIYLLKPERVMEI
jgi:hypothetical protein